MRRISLRIPNEQLEEIERLVNEGKYPNRSEAIRAAVREMLDQDQPNWLNAQRQ